MPTRTYNTFYQGEKQDDFLTGGPSFIEHKNVDGIRDGYGITLGPKSNKQLLTNKPIKAFIDRSSIIGNNWAVGDGGEIYQLDGVDNTPLYTLIDTNFNITGGFYLSSNYYFVGRFDTTSPGTQVKIAKISVFDAESGNWIAMNESFETGLSTSTTTPILISGQQAYLGTRYGVYTLDGGTGIGSTKSFTDDYVTGLTLEGTTIAVFSVSGNMYLWIPGSTNYSTLKDLGERIQKVTSDGNRNYIATETGNIHVESGLSSQRITRSVKSRRLNDNSQYIDKLNFSNNVSDNITITAGGSDIYMISGNAIYKYGNLIDGLSKGYNKILDTGSQGPIDEIFSLFFHRKSSKLLYSYRSGTKHAIDYIDLLSKQTTNDGYVITDVFTGGSSFKKQLKRLRISTSYTSTTNTIKLYYRVNNGIWELIRNISEPTDVITVDNIYQLSDGTTFKNFIDVQFKVEFHSDNGDDTPPILHELLLDYETIET